MQALLTAIVVAAICFAVLSLFEVALHRLFHWKSKNYRYGVWLLTVLIGIYAYGTSLGR